MQNSGFTPSVAICEYFDSSRALRSSPLLPADRWPISSAIWRQRAVERAAPRPASAAIRAMASPCTRSPFLMSAAPGIFASKPSESAIAFSSLSANAGMSRSRWGRGKVTRPVANGRPAPFAAHVRFSATSPPRRRV